MHCDRIARRQKGFTLVELITVILIMAAVSLGVVNFVSDTSQIFVDVSERDATLSDGRFVVERLNRELRYALPNSTRVAINTSGSGSSLVVNSHCIEFVPIKWSGFYLDLPVSPDSAQSSFEVAELIGISSSYASVEADSHYVIVYPTVTSTIYETEDTSGGGRRVGLSSVGTDTDSDGDVDLNLDSAMLFEAESPISRYYIVGQPVSYCLSSGSQQITRHADYGFQPTQSATVGGGIIGDGVVMAENLVNSLSSDTLDDTQNSDDPFRVAESTLTRNATVRTLLRFDRNDEVVDFYNEIHLQNVP